MKIEAARDKHEAELMQRPNVVGVGIGERAGKRVIKVFVTRKVPLGDLHPHEVIPSSVGGHETDVEEIGVVTSQT